MIPIVVILIAGSLVSTARRNDGGQLQSLPVIGQHLVAGPAEPGAMLLKTAQNHRIAVAHDSPAKTGDIARAGVVPLLR
jgi:hypothetical protein